MQQRFRELVKHAVIWQIALACYWLVLFAATHMPSDMAALPGAWTDKFVHVGAFAILAMLLATAWQLKAGPLRVRHLAAALLVLVVYGAIDESTQTLVGRHASIWDVFGDALGALLGLTMFASLMRLLNAKLQSTNRSEMPDQ